MDRHASKYLKILDKHYLQDYLTLKKGEYESIILKDMCRVPVWIDNKVSYPYRGKKVLRFSYIIHDLEEKFMHPMTSSNLLQSNFWKDIIKIGSKSILSSPPFNFSNEDMLSEFLKTDVAPTKRVTQNMLKKELVSKLVSKINEMQSRF